ncbi:MAG: T9SS type A sorting domain-containing protein [Saprospiraceae bacterium]|nr:T9SS type A sorting domain-containing protein [Candidatus Vicinibacter affinis]
MSFNSTQDLLLVTSKISNLNQIELFDLSGKSIGHSFLTSAKEGVLNLRNVLPGIFLVKVTLENNEMIYFRKIKTK